MQKWGLLLDALVQYLPIVNKVTHIYIQKKYLG